MPLYEYACAQCGRFEALQKLSDQPLGACPTCGGAIHRLISAPAIQFKGSGWYVTDYARKPAPDSAVGKSTSSDSKTDSSNSSPKSTTSTDNSAAGSSPTD